MTSIFKLIDVKLKAIDIIYCIQGTFLQIRILAKTFICIQVEMNKLNFKGISRM